MKKTIFLAMIATVMALTSCSSDDKPGTESSRKFWVEYVCQPSAEWFDYYDITATYKDISGKTITKTLSPTDGLNYKASVPENEISLEAREFKCSVTAVKKADVTPAEDTKVNLSSNTKCLLSLGESESKAALLGTGTAYFGEINTQGTPIASFLKKHQTGNFIDFYYNNIN